MTAIHRIAGTVVGSTIDWLGHTTMVFFYQGCNFRCPWCQNGDLIPIDTSKVMSEKAIARLIDEDIVCDALMVSGGEPTLYPDSLEFVLGYAKHAGLLTCLNTNGSKPDVVVDLIDRKFIDHIAMDIKSPLFPMEYREMTGLGMTEHPYLTTGLINLMAIIKKYKIPLEVRTTVVPGTPSTKIVEIIDEIRDYADEFHIQQYDNTKPYNPKFKSILPPDYKALVNAGKVAFDAGIPKVVVKTKDHETVVFSHNKQDNLYIPS